jgi:hypothetical protein
MVVHLLSWFDGLRFAVVAKLAVKRAERRTEELPGGVR